MIFSFYEMILFSVNPCPHTFEYKIVIYIDINVYVGEPFVSTLSFDVPPKDIGFKNAGSCFWEPWGTQGEREFANIEHKLIVPLHASPKNLEPNQQILKCIYKTNIYTVDLYINYYIYVLCVYGIVIL